MTKKQSDAIVKTLNDAGIKFSPSFKEGKLRLLVACFSASEPDLVFVFRQIDMILDVLKDAGFRLLGREEVRRSGTLLYYFLTFG